MLKKLFCVLYLLLTTLPSITPQDTIQQEPTPIVQKSDRLTPLLLGAVLGLATGVIGGCAFIATPQTQETQDPQKLNTLKQDNTNLNSHLNGLKQNLVQEQGKLKNLTTQSQKIKGEINDLNQKISTLRQKLKL